MAVDAAFPFLAGVVATVFAGVVWRKHAARSRPHSLAWGLGLGAYAVASFIEAFVTLNGWTPTLYRAYFPLAAALVGFLGLGTVYLLRERRVGHAFAVFVVVAFAVAALGASTVPLAADAPVTAGGETRPLAEWGPEVGGAAVPFPHPARVAFLALNVLGGLALIGGAAWSGWQLRKAGVLLIGVGALFPFTGGALSTLGVPDARVIAQFIGIAIMFTGYLAGERAARARPSRAGAVADGSGNR